MEGAARFTVGFTLPSLSYQLTREGNRPWGLDGGETIVFYMRPNWSDALVVSGGAVTIIDVASDTVRYDWTSGDVDTAGDYRGWFRVTDGSSVEETDEFDIVGLAHAPGAGVPIGAIARAAKREMPIDWDVLERLPSFGTAEIQEKVELVKLTVLNTVITPAAEAGLDRRVIDYLGKKVAIELIPAAISYWMNQIQAQTARGSEEIQSFPNRINALENKLKYLIAAAHRLEMRIADLIGIPVTREMTAPAVDAMGPMVTPGLETFHRPFGGQSPDPRRHSPVGVAPPWECLR